MRTGNKLCADCLRPYGDLWQVDGAAAGGHCSMCRKYLQVTPVKAILSKPALKPRRPRLIWRRQPDEKGLAAVCQSPRGKELRHAGKTLGLAKPKGSWGSRKGDGYYWYGGWDDYGVPHQNTASTSFATLEDACSDMLKHFQDHIDAYLKAQEETK